MRIASSAEQKTYDDTVEPSAEQQRHDRLVRSRERLPTSHSVGVMPLADTCPTCGQPKPTGFATGTRSLSPATDVRGADDPPDPNGPEGYEVIVRLARGEAPEAIARDMGMMLSQVTAIQPLVTSMAANIKVGEIR